jgi:LysM repeat protein
MDTTSAVEIVRNLDENSTSYTVQRGDTLSAIAKD